MQGPVGCREESGFYQKWHEKPLEVLNSEEGSAP